MKEARIECICQEFPIHDLGLSLKQGQVEFVDETVAKNSRDLMTARRVKAVTVTYVQRARTTREPPQRQGRRLVKQTASAAAGPEVAPPDHQAMVAKRLKAKAALPPEPGEPVEEEPETPPKKKPTNGRRKGAKKKAVAKKKAKKTEEEKTDE